MRIIIPSLRLATVAAIAGALALFAYAFAAANVVPGAKAGDGAGTVSGYTVSNVAYNLNGTNPQNIDSVTFDVDSDPTGSTTMKIRLVSSGSDWYTCTNVTTALTCVTTAPQATVAATDELRVVIAD